MRGYTYAHRKGVLEELEAHIFSTGARLYRPTNSAMQLRIFADILPRLLETLASDVSIREILLASASDLLKRTRLEQGSTTMRRAFQPDFLDVDHAVVEQSGTMNDYAPLEGNQSRKICALRGKTRLLVCNELRDEFCHVNAEWHAA